MGFFDSLVSALANGGQGDPQAQALMTALQGMTQPGPGMPQVPQMPVGAMPTGQMFGPPMPPQAMPPNPLAGMLGAFGGAEAPQAMGAPQGAPPLADLLGSIGATRQAARAKFDQILPPAPNEGQSMPQIFGGPAPAPVAPAGPPPLVFQPPQQASAGPQVSQISIPAPGGAKATPTAQTDPNRDNVMEGILGLARKDSGNNYNALTYGGKVKEAPLTDMTISEVYRYQDKMIQEGHASTAAGGYQFIKPTLQSAVEKLGLDPDKTKFTPEVQDALARQLVVNRGYNEFKSGQMDGKKFAKNLSQEWAILPKDESGAGFYDGVNGNKSGVGFNDVMATLSGQGTPAAAGRAQVSGPPGAPNFVSPNLPIPAAPIPGAQIDLAAFDAWQKARPQATAPMSTGDRITNILANMAGGARGATNVGDVLLGAGGGAAAGAAQNISRERGEKKSDAELLREFMEKGAGVEVRKAQAAQQNTQQGIDAKNLGNQNLQQVQLAQEKINAELKNRQLELQHDIDMKSYMDGKPQITTGKEGQIISIARKPNGEADVSVVDTGQAHREADQLKEMRTVIGDKKGPLDDPAEWQYYQKKFGGSSEAFRQVATEKIVRDEVQNGNWRDIFKDEAKKIEKRADARVDPKLIGSPQYQKLKDEAVYNVLMEDRRANPEKFEQFFMKEAQKKNNYGALKYWPQRNG